MISPCGRHPRPGSSVRMSRATANRDPRASHAVETASHDGGRDKTKIVDRCAARRGAFATVVLLLRRAIVLNSGANRPTNQPHQLDIALGFTLRAAARLDPVEIAVEVDLQQRRGRPSRRCWR